MPYESPISPNCPVIHDGNYLDFVSGNGRVVDGQMMSTGLELQQGRMCEFVKPFDLPLIPESEWEDRIQEMDRDKSSLDDVMMQEGVRIKNQDGWGYCVFGKVTAGMDVVDQIAATPTGPVPPFGRDVPLTAVVIRKATVTE